MKMKIVISGLVLIGISIGWWVFRESGGANGAEGSAEGGSSQAKTRERSGHGGSGPRDPRLRRLFEDDATGYRVEHFKGFLERSGSKPTSVLACYLLTDQDRDGAELLAGLPAEPAVAWTLPFWRDQEAAALVSESYRSSEGLAFPDVLHTGFRPGMSEAEARQWIEELSGLQAPDFRQLELVDEEMRAALRSIGVEGTEAGILIEQRSVSPRSVIGRSAARMSEAWTEGREDLYGSERLDFDRKLLAYIEESLARCELKCPPLLRLQDSLARGMEFDDPRIEIDGVPIKTFINETQVELDESGAFDERFYKALGSASPEAIDRYFADRRVDSGAAERQLIDSVR